MQCTRDDSILNHEPFTTGLKLTNSNAHWCLRGETDISANSRQAYTGLLMKRHFEGRTKSEAQERANAWWRTQSAHAAILWVTRPTNDDEPPTNCEVVVRRGQVWEDDVRQGRKGASLPPPSGNILLGLDEPTRNDLPTYAASIDAEAVRLERGKKE